MNKEELRARAIEQINAIFDEDRDHGVLVEDVLTQAVSRMSVTVAFDTESLAWANSPGGRTIPQFNFPNVVYRYEVFRRDISNLAEVRTQDGLDFTRRLQAAEFLERYTAERHTKRSETFRAKLQEVGGAPDDQTPIVSTAWDRLDQDDG